VLSGMRDYLKRKGVKLLADGGYASYDGTLVIPKPQEKDQEWNRNQSSYRSIVETIIGLVHAWQITSKKFVEVVLLCVYELAHRHLQKYPLGQRRPRKK
jgi:hypothetical protein